MTKYNVGDKVRVVKTEYTCVYNGYNIGDIFEVSSVHSESLGTVDGPRLWFREIEKVSDKPTKNQRITTLESQVAELQAEVAALKKAQATPKFVPVTTDNIAVGDKIRVINVSGISLATALGFKNGDITTVVDVEPPGIRVTDIINGGYPLCVGEHELYAIEKVVSE